MNKLLGYFTTGIGLIGLIVTYAPVNQLLGSPIPASLTTIATAVTGIILVIGIFLLSKSKTKTKEVPIYEGQKIVGYRVIQQKA